jgi:hypothetical protein
MYGTGREGRLRNQNGADWKWAKRKGRPNDRTPFAQKGNQGNLHGGGLCEVTEEPEQRSRKQRRYGQREDPGRGDVAEGGHLQSAAVGGHGASHA